MNDKPNNRIMNVYLNQSKSKHKFLPVARACMWIMYLLINIFCRFFSCFLQIIKIIGITKNN
jgi:hypothetical protein